MVMYDTVLLFDPVAPKESYVLIFNSQVLIKKYSRCMVFGDYIFQYIRKMKKENYPSRKLS